MSSEKGKTFALTLGNPQLCRLYKDTQLAVLRYVDFLFSNAEVKLDDKLNSEKLLIPRPVHVFFTPAASSLTRGKG